VPRESVIMRYSIQQATEQQVQSVGATHIVLAPRSKIIFADLSEEQVLRLKALGCLVSNTQETKTEVTPPTPLIGEAIYTPKQLLDFSGLEEVRNLLRPPLHGEGMTIAILGTGIRELHELIAGRVVYSKNFTSSLMEDTFDHDTGVASLVLAVAPYCNIINLKVLDENGIGTDEEVVLALEECMRLHDENSPYRPVVINCSFGAEDTGDPNAAMRVACRETIKRGIWTAASAGNAGPSPSTITSPACEEDVGAVGSCSAEPFEISEFSSRGPTKENLPKPDVVYFGENIIMASSKSDTSTIAKSGTSFSLPLVAGMAILYCEGMTRYGKVEFKEISDDAQYPLIMYPAITPTELETLFPNICVKPQGIPTGRDNNYGYGLIWGALVKNAMIAAVGVPDLAAIFSPIITIALLSMIMKGIK